MYRGSLLSCMDHAFDVVPIEPRWHHGAMNVRNEITLDEETHHRVEARAAELGISFGDYVRRAPVSHLGPPPPEKKVDISAVFDLVTDGPGTNIARDKDKMIGEAVWQEYLRKTSRLKPRSPRTKTKPRQ